LEIKQTYHRHNPQSTSVRDNAKVRTLVLNGLKLLQLATLGYTVP